MNIGVIKSVTVKGLGSVRSIADYDVVRDRFRVRVCTKRRTVVVPCQTMTGLTAAYRKAIAVLRKDAKR